jgi:hypothetical protein
VIRTPPVCRTARRTPYQAGFTPALPTALAVGARWPSPAPVPPLPANKFAGSVTGGASVTGAALRRAAGCRFVRIEEEWRARLGAERLAGFRDTLLTLLAGDR